MARNLRSIRDLRLVITGSFGFSDIGDEAMLTEDLNYIRSDLGIPDANITLLGQDPDYVSRFHCHPRENCLSSRRLQSHGEAAELRGSAAKRVRNIVTSLVRLRGFARRDQELARILSSADAALVTGGGTINTRDSKGYSVKRMHDMVCGIKAHGLPLFISGQTIGPLGLHPRHDEMAARIVHSADVLTVRDRLYSRGYLETIHGLPNELLETFDDAYTLAYEDSKLPHETESFLAADPPVAALNITDYTSETAGQMAYVARICDWLVQQDGVRVVLLSHTPLDFARLHRIYNMCEAATKASVHQPDTREWTGAQLKKAISRCVAAIGGRYHFIVFAGTSNTPFVGMAGNHYSYIKQNGFAEPLGLSRLILGERETWDFETLTARYREAKAMSLDLSSRFQRPSESMARFGRWLSESVLPKVRKT